MKGTVADLLVLMITAIILVSVFGLLYYIGVQAQAQFSLIGMDVTPITKATAGIGILLNGIPFITTSLGLVAIVFAFMIPSHPIFAPVSMIILAMYVIVSTFFSNIFYNMATNTVLTSIFNSFPLTVYVMQYLPYIIAIFGTVIIIVEFSKVGGRQDAWA